MHPDGELPVLLLNDSSDENEALEEAPRAEGRGREMRDTQVTDDGG